MLDQKINEKNPEQVSKGGFADLKQADCVCLDDEELNLVSGGVNFKDERDALVQAPEIPRS